jgi:beta-lactam-binding protein with PASTA domain
MFKFITRRPLWMNIAAGIVLAIALFALFILSLKMITHHGRSRNVPFIIGKSYDDAEKLLSKEGFEVIVQDSVYVDSLPPLTVIKQIPESESVVKVNRTVYVTINRSIPPVVEMPNLIGYSFRNAEMTLSNMGLKIGDTIYKADFAKNSVLQQLYHGESISPGTKIQMGSSISLVLGSGVGEAQFIVPWLVGMTFGDAKAKLEANGLNIIPLYVDPSVKDTMNAYIVNQDPQRYDEMGNPLRIRTGQMISVWLGLNKPVKRDTLFNNNNNNNQF